MQSFQMPLSGKLQIPGQANYKFQVKVVVLMPKQHVKTNAEVSRCTDSQQYGKHEHFVVQHLLQERNRRATCLG